MHVTHIGRHPSFFCNVHHPFQIVEGFGCNPNAPTVVREQAGLGVQKHLLDRNENVVHVFEG